VLSEPREAGIDPRHLLIDTELADNSRRVTRGLISPP
jgi:hypothetical protein